MEGLIDIGDQVIGVFDADAHSDQAVDQTERGALLEFASPRALLAARGLSSCGLRTCAWRRVTRLGKRCCYLGPPLASHTQFPALAAI